MLPFWLTECLSPLPLMCSNFLSEGLLKKKEMRRPFRFNEFLMCSSKHSASITIDCGTKWPKPNWSEPLLTCTDRESFLSYCDLRHRAVALFPSTSCRSFLLAFLAFSALLSNLNLADAATRPLHVQHGLRWRRFQTILQPVPRNACLMAFLLLFLCCAQLKAHNSETIQTC